MFVCLCVCNMILSSLSPQWCSQNYEVLMRLGVVNVKQFQSGSVRAAAILNTFRQILNALFHEARLKDT